MIAWAGAERLALGITDALDAPPHARWSLHDVTGPAQGQAPHAQAQHADANKNG